MKSKTLINRLFPIFLSINMAITAVSPAYATPTEATIAADSLLSVSDNQLQTNILSDPNDTREQLETQADEQVLTPEAAESKITITFVDADGTTVLHGPIEKDLTELTTPSNGRYAFDEIQDGVSVPTTNGNYVLPYIHNGRKITNWIKASNSNKYNFHSVINRPFTASETITAVYGSGSYRYSLEYDMDGGIFDLEEDQSTPYNFTVDSEVITLPNVYKKGFQFVGWQVTNASAGAAYNTIITSIPSGTQIEYTYGDVVGNDVFTGYQLKAIYNAITVLAPTSVTAKNTKTGVANVSITPDHTDADSVCYELSYATNNKFKKNTTHVIDLGNKTSYQITNMPKGKTYFFKARTYKVDSKGERIYSSFSSVSQMKVTKGVSETSKITGSSATLKAANVKIDGNQNLFVTANAKKRLKSFDDFYYLVSIDPNNGKILGAVAESDKTKKVIFQTPVRDENGTNLINGKYAVAVKTSKKQFKQISSAFFIKNPEGAADYTAAYPVTKSKKGIQGSLNTELGVQQGYTNFMLNSLYASKGSGTKYVYNGKTYYFNEPYEVTSYASSCNSAGITCSVQIMLRWPGNTSYKSLLFGTSSAKSPTDYYAINSSTPQSRELIEAAFSFLADRCSKADCHVDNWILGNEVNIYDQWYYAGGTGYDAFMKNYASTFRILYNSVKGRNQNAHIFICTDHTWKNRSGDWGAKPFMDSFHSHIKAMNPSIQWNLAYHAYPSILYMPATWRDSYAPDSEGADFVSPKNLQVLTNYVKKTYGSKTRIIISECGFTNADGEAVQAAALAYSFYKAQFDDMIDAFIIRTEIDAKGETLRRLDGVVIDAAFGLRSANGTQRASYNVFKYMDTPKYEQYTNSCLKTIGANSWNAIIPGFKDSTLKALPNR